VVSGKLRILGAESTPLMLKPRSRLFLFILKSIVVGLLAVLFLHLFAPIALSFVFGAIIFLTFLLTQEALPAEPLTLQRFGIGRIAQQLRTELPYVPLFGLVGAAAGFLASRSKHSQLITLRHGATSSSLILGGMLAGVALGVVLPVFYELSRASRSSRARAASARRSGSTVNSAIAGGVIGGVGGCILAPILATSYSGRMVLSCIPVGAAAGAIDAAGGPALAISALYVTGRLPLRFSKFLETCSRDEVGILRRAAYGYEFRHRSIADVLAKADRAHEAGDRLE
jgi:hypothetical protein